MMYFLRKTFRANVKAAKQGLVTHVCVMSHLVTHVFVMSHLVTHVCVMSHLVTHVFVMT